MKPFNPYWFIMFLSCSFQSALAMDPTPEQQLFDIAATGSKKTGKLVHALISQGTSLECRDARGATPLIRAALAGNGFMVLLLLKKNANVHAQAKDGCTALMKIMRHGNVQTCKALLNAGAIINATDCKKQTVLHHVARAVIPTLHFMERSAIDQQQYGPDKRRVICVCKDIIAAQRKINKNVFTALLLFKRMRQDNVPLAEILYRQFKTLMLYHFEFLPVRSLLEMKDHEGKTAYDICHLECLNPEL